MTLLAIDHVVLVVASIEQGITAWQDKLGLDLTYQVDLTDNRVAQAFFSLKDGTFIELIAPMAEDSELNSVLKSRPEGIYALAMKVEDLTSSADQLQKRGVRLIGAGTTRVFIHPKSANGILIQLWPKTQPHRWRDALRLP